MTKRDRYMILGVLSFVAVVVFWMFMLNPQRKAAKDAQLQLDTAKQSLAAAQAKLTAGRAAQQAFRRDRTTIVKLGRVVPETDDIPTLLTQLQTLAKKYDVTFASYKIDAGGGAGAATSTSASGKATSVPQGAGGAAATKVDEETNAIAPLYPPGSVEISGGLGRTPITVDLIGGYFQLERYLRAVQRFAVLSAKQSTTKGRLMIVDGFTYKPTDHITTVKSDPDEYIKTDHTRILLEAELGASVYFAPPLDVPSAAAAAASVAGSGATPAAAPGTATTATGAAAVGGIR